MVVEQGLSARLFNSQVIETRGLLPLFEELSQFGVKCQYPTNDTLIEPVEYYQLNLSREFYYLSVETHSAVMSLDPDGEAVIFSAGLDYIKDERNVNLIQSMGKLTDALFTALAFKYAFADLEGDAPPKLYEDIEGTRIRWLFWANYFGKDYVKKSGKEFLLRAPGWRSEELPDGTVKYMTRSDPRMKIDAATKKAITAYFLPEHKVKIYQWEKFRFD
jgi:hypothetical protein